MSELPVIAVWAIIFAAGGAQPGLVGTPLGPGDEVPAGVRGLLLREGVVVLLGPYAAVRSAPEAGWVYLERGRIRVVTSLSGGVSIGPWRVTVDQSEALVTSERPGEVEVCAPRPGVMVRRVIGERFPEPPGDDAASDTEMMTVAPGSCLTLGIEGSRAERPSEPEAFAEISQALNEQGPPPAELPDVVGDLSAQVEEVEGSWADRLDQGPQREAASCGCSESGGSGGMTDLGGGSTIPHPEPTSEPGTLRVRIRLPRH